MHINRGSIGGLIGVHVSSIVKWGCQDNFKPDFFLRKFFLLQKAPSAQQTTFTLLEVCASGKFLP